ncbi:MAG: hypothetical protein AAFY46_16150, partial [Planctomycetota bacterium]
MFAGSAAAQHTLRYNIEPGLTYGFEQTVSMRMDLDMTSGFQQMQLDQQSEQVASGTIEVLSAHNGATSVARLTFDRESGSVITSSMMPQPQRVPFELAGRAIVATVLPNGSLSIADDRGETLDGLLPDTVQLVRSVAVPDPAFPPADAVALDESWTT